MSELEVIHALGKVVLDLQERVNRQEETLKSLSKWLTVAFREMGFDFEKIAQLESSRWKDKVQNDVEVQMDPEEIDPVVQDDIAKRILARGAPHVLDSWEAADETSNKGRKQ